MGVSIQQWRAVIGCFSQPLKVRTRLKTLSLKYVSLSVRILLFFLLVVEGVEANPGPPKSVSGRGSRGRGDSSGALGFGAPRGRGSRQADYFADFPSLERSRSTSRISSIRRSQRIHDQSSLSRQSSLNTWLMSSQPQQPRDTSDFTQRSDNVTDVTDSDTEHESTEGGGNNDTLDVNPTNMTELLLEIRKDVKSMTRKFGNLEKTVKDLKKDNKLLKKQNEGLSNQVSALSKSVSRLEVRTTEAERKNEQLEAQSRRDNLKFHGIKEDRGETWEQSEGKVREYLSAELNMDVRDMKIERAHRLPSRSSPRPLIVKFSHFKDRELVLKNYREHRKNLQGAATENGEHVDADADGRAEHVRVSEDFPMRVTKARTNLFPFLKSCHANDKEAFLRYDMLVVEGQSYVYDSDLQKPVLFK